MPPILAIATLAAGGYILARALRREMARVEMRVSEAARKQAETQDVKTLERDPDTGRYRPRG